MLSRFFKDRRRRRRAVARARRHSRWSASVGAAVDYSRANAVRTAMQAALDSTALMLSKDAQNLNGDQLGREGHRLFQRRCSIGPEAQQRPGHASSSARPSRAASTSKVTGTATINTMFWRLLGQPQIDITATGEVLWGIKKLNLALALDNTGSMASSGKMTALKEAAHNLLTTLKNAEKTPGDIKVSIVPFAVDVNVGTGNVDAPLDRLDRLGGRQRHLQQVVVSLEEQLHVRQRQTWTPASHSTWNGCVNDRDQNNDVINTATLAGSPATMYRAHQASRLPDRDDAADLRLDRAEQPRSTR